LIRIGASNNLCMTLPSSSLSQNPALMLSQYQNSRGDPGWMKADTASTAAIQYRAFWATKPGPV
jgi:hypothetical protein